MLVHVVQMDILSPYEAYFNDLEPEGFSILSFCQHTDPSNIPHVGESSLGVCSKSTWVRSQRHGICLRRFLFQGTIGCTPNSVPMVFIVFSRDSWG